MRRILAVLIVLMLTGAAYADVDFHVEAKGAILIDADSGRVLFEQNADERLPMASTTKIMTALLAIEHGNLSEVIEAPAEACGITGTSIYLTEGEKLTLEQLLYGLMLRSGNDAATAIAIHIGGSQQEFVEMMNKRAEEMGIDAGFANPHGLDAEGHSASARAMAELMRAAMEHEEFARITSTTKKIIPWEGNEYSRVLYNKNRLLTSYDGTLGGKTGYTGKAGRCLVFAAERNGLTLIGCVLNCSTWFDTAERMLDYGFENYSAVNAVGAGEIVDNIDVTGGQARTVDIRLSEALVFPLGLDEDYVIRTEINSAAAPLKAGTAAGRIYAVIDGVSVAEGELVYAADVLENDMENAMRRIIGGWVLQF
ncbi:MAG: D-alanyl-D-alanine carboxypeptidase [Clostridia bacterium]|nr:D-alanyl-D-alanine carboxypeptidase [Clostridia bacterium]